MPTSGTVTSVNVEIDTREFDTVIIPNSETAKIKAKQNMAKSRTASDAESIEQMAAVDPLGSLPRDVSCEEYMPDLFRLPIQGVQSGEMVTVTTVYIETLPYYLGRYHFGLPLAFGDHLIPKSKRMEDIISVQCIINSVCNHTHYDSPSHTLKCTRSEFPFVELQVAGFDKFQTKTLARASTAAAPPGHHSTEDTFEDDGSAYDTSVSRKTVDAADLSRKSPRARSESIDFKLSYALAADKILPTMLVEEREGGGQGSFLLFVTPPALERVSGFFTRTIIFLLDRSGSMGGAPYREATRALTAALQALRPADRFNVIAFDHTQQYFSLTPVRATPAQLQAAANWVSTHQPLRGGTDIHTPLAASVDLLESEDPKKVGLPFVVLLTDGCVANEREICMYAKGKCKNTRLLTLGIGSYCNWFFLKMLAYIGRGFSDVVSYQENIYDQMTQLLSMAAVPVMTNISVEFPGVRQFDMYPDPIPDLFMGAPLTQSGEYQSDFFPQEVILRAVSPYGEPICIKVPVRVSSVIPVSKVFLKQRLDMLTAQAWLEQSAELQREIVDLSCTEMVPSAYTSMVAFELEPTESETAEAPLLGAGGRDRERKKRDRKALEELKRKSGRKWYKDPKVLGTIATANAAVVGVMAFSFGDLAASTSNLASMGGEGAMAAIASGVGEQNDGCCGCCKDDGCENCDCGDCICC